MTQRERWYIAGPMRGIPKFNYPLFHAAAAMLERAGVRRRDIVNPAALDGGEPPEPGRERPFSEYMRRDILAMLHPRPCANILLLPGWERSEGVAVERAVARAIGAVPHIGLFSPQASGIRGMPWSDIDALAKPVATTTPIIHETILAEAARITGGDRKATYGHCRDNHLYIARRWTAALAGPTGERKISSVEPLTAQDVIDCMIETKLARAKHKAKRDNWVDVAGYGRLGGIIDGFEEQ